MVQKFEKTEIMEISDVFIMFGLAVLYACACPIACLIVMVFNIIDIKWDLRMQYVCIRRPIAQVRANIGPWLFLAEFMALAAVVSNCLLLYFSSPILRKWLSDTFDIDEEANTLWIIVGIEHVIIMLKVFSASAI
jgi:anoctamin-10